MTGQIQTVLRVAALAGAIFYYAAFALDFRAAGNKKFALWRNILWGAGFAVNAGLVVYHFVINGYVPFITIYQVLTFLSFCYFPIYLYMRYMRDAGWMSRYFLLMPAVIMTGLFFMTPSVVWERAPVLQSIWFVPHIFIYMVAYTMAGVAFLICLQSFFVKKKKDKERMQDGVYDCVCLLFPFMTAGMFIGAIWANEVWGGFWSWDFKEIWALITWLFFTLYLHFRREKKLQKIAPVFVILGFIGIFVTMVLVNFISADTTQMHSYAF